MRSSITTASLCIALAFLLLATLTPSAIAGHGHLKERQDQSQLKSIWDKYFANGQPGFGSRPRTTTSTRTTNTATRSNVKITTSTSRSALTSTTSKSATTTSNKPATTSSSTKPATTSSKPATTSKATTSSSSSSSSVAATTTGTSGGGSLSAFAQNILTAHNNARAPRGASALTWSTAAEAAAKAWGDKCVWQHGGADGMGQNLAASAGYKQTGQQVVDAWMSEEKDYNPSNPTYSHFTQVVWKNTKQVGCYQSTCTKLLNPDGSETFPGFSPAYYTVCNYAPPGNYAGQYAQNVEKL